MKLYKFHPINIYLLHSLRNKTNWYSKLAHLNDPYDCYYIDNTDTPIYKDLLSTFCVCCFSKNMNEILMWSHYADNHKGVCLEWEIDELDIDIKERLFEISYQDEIITLDFVKTNKGFLDINISSNGKFLIQKFKNWEYEKEVRCYVICEDKLKTGESKDYIGKLTTIYFGKNVTQDNIDLIKHNTSHYPNLKYYRTMLNEATMKNDKLIEV